MLLTAIWSLLALLRTRGSAATGLTGAELSAPPPRRHRLVTKALLSVPTGSKLMPNGKDS